METQGQHAKIEQFTVLLKMCKGPGVEDAVTNSLAAAGLFAYGELACLPSMQQVAFLVYTSNQPAVTVHLRLIIVLHCVTCPCYMQLKGGDHDMALNTLELFAYGTWADYKGASKLHSCALTWYVQVNGPLG